MNETIKKGEEMIGQKLSLAEVIQAIAGKMLETRPKCVAKYRPYMPIKGVSFQHPLGNMRIDLDEMFPDAKFGSKVCIEFNISVLYDDDIFLNVMGEVEVYYNGKKIFEVINGDPVQKVGMGGGLYNVSVNARADQYNNVKIVCTKRTSPFECLLNLSVKRYPGMWASDYLNHIRAISPVDRMGNEDGIAVFEILEEGVDFDNMKRCYPQIVKKKGFDFDELCEKGKIAYVYTKVKKEHKLSYDGTVDKIFINGKEAGDLKPYVHADDDILFRCRRNGSKWFLNIEDEFLYIPNLESNRQYGDRAVFSGPYYSNENINADLSQVYKNDLGEKLFWRFNDGSQLRIYIDSCFFGQWFYAHMIGFYGMLSAGRCLSDEHYVELFDYNMKFMADHFEYVQFDIEKKIMPTFMPRIAEANVLDNLGSMGMNFIESYFNTRDTELMKTINWIWGNMSYVPVMNNGNYYRVNTMWADDLFMSCPFLVRMGLLKMDKNIIDKAVQQIIGYAEYLYDEQSHLFSHIYFTNEKKANNIFWGRGNGWVMWTLTEVLPYIENTKHYDELLHLFCDMSRSISEKQDKSGLWRQVLDCNDECSYPETSCTAIFLLAFIRGVKNKWLDSSYISVIKKAWRGLLTKSIDREGNIYGVCMGSECSMNKKYYVDIPTAVNDEHGIGVVLAAASELLELKNTDERVDI